MPSIKQSESPSRFRSPKLPLSPSSPTRVYSRKARQAGKKTAEAGRGGEAETAGKAGSALCSSALLSEKCQHGRKKTTKGDGGGGLAANEA
jgi:hypothetical protein